MKIELLKAVDQELEMYPEAFGGAVTSEEVTQAEAKLNLYIIYYIYYFTVYYLLILFIYLIYQVFLLYYTSKHNLILSY